MTDDGVRISTREIYQLVIETAKTVQRIEDTIKNINQTDERCRHAVDTAERAMEMIKEYRERRSSFAQLFWGAVITGIITFLLWLLTGGRIN